MRRTSMSARLLACVTAGMCIPWLGCSPQTQQPKSQTTSASSSSAALDCTGSDGVSAEDMRRTQQAWAKHLGRQVEETVEIADGVKITFVLIPPGKFRMGSPADEKDRDA